MKKRLTLNKVIIIVIFAVFIFSLIRQGVALKRIKENLSVERQNLNQLKEENEKLKNKDTNKVSLEIKKSKTMKKIYVSDKQIGLGILTNWTGRKLDFLFANKINELVQAVNQLGKKTEE